MAGSIFNSIGISVDEGINIYLRKVISEGGIPFSVKANLPTDKLAELRYAWKVEMNDK